MANRIIDREAFIRANTRVQPVAHVPEVRLHLAEESVLLWQRTEEELGEIGLPPPFWAFAWAGGQALARYVLDRPETVRGKDVLDLASGSGLVGIAAMKAGARQVLAADIDAFAQTAIRMNAEVNEVSVSATADNLLEAEPGGYGTVLIGDLFYEKGLAGQATDWMMRAREKGSLVLIGDPGRSYLPRERLEKLAEYAVPVTRELEDSEIRRTAVWRLAV